MTAKTRLLATLLFGALLPLLAPGADRPNILWLSAEDHGPHLGCYGDAYADTQNVDAFAGRSLLYTTALSTAPVCAPARTTIITGMYAPSLGGQHMRSEAKKPEWLKFYPEFLREAGYYCTNHTKTDYNVAHNLKQVWDDSSKNAHYKNRKDGQPFFAIFNHTGTHESKIRKRNHTPIHDPAKAPVPPYHPDTPEVRNNWAQYHDNITAMDKWFAGHLKALGEAGLAEDTIVIFWADHGSGMPRGKRYAGWSGLHVPLIVHIPEKWKHLRPDDYQAGGRTDRPVGFVDFGATMLSLVGIKPADFQQGRAFLGKHIAPAPKYAYGFRGRMDERPDCSRTITDGKFVYIRNFMPHVPHGQSLAYQLETQATRVWRRLHREGKLNKVQSYFWGPKVPEELYDLTADPHETVNLADSKKHAARVKEMRAALYANLKATHDLALMPEGMFHDEAEKHGVTPGDLALNPEGYPFDEILPAADLLLDPELNPEKVVPALTSDHAACRYWGALACLYKGKGFVGGSPAYSHLNKLLKDPSPSVRIAAAEALATHPFDATTRELVDLPVSKLIEDANPEKTSAYHAVAALNALEHLLAELTPDQKAAIAALPTRDPEAPGRVNGYADRMQKHIANPIPDHFAKQTRTRKKDRK